MAKTEDLMENKMTEVSSVSKVRGLDKDGNSVIISLQNLFAKAFVDRLYVTDFNQAFQNGVYEIHAGYPTSNAPSGITYGILVTFNTVDNFLFQIAADVAMTTLKTRGRSNNVNEWSAWKSISLT